jgi:hypothetical protein
MATNVGDLQDGQLYYALTGNTPLQTLEQFYGKLKGEELTERELNHVKAVFSKHGLTLEHLQTNGKLALVDQELTDIGIHLLGTRKAILKVLSRV